MLASRSLQPYFWLHTYTSNQAGSLFGFTRLGIDRTFIRSGGSKMAYAATKHKAVNHETKLLDDLGEVVRRRRLALNLSQEELAFRAGVHRTYLSDIERGARNITVTVLTRLAEALELKVSRLFRLTELYKPDRAKARNGRAR